jgi:FkbM family methyltransferase
MDKTLKVLRSVTTRLPVVRGAGRLAYSLMRLYQRKPREEVVANVLGFRMRLAPNDLIGGALLFCPQFYDNTEIRFILRTLQPGDTFCDVGANLGFYSLVAARVVGKSGRVIAIEADPDNFADLTANIALNEADNVTAIEAGVSDRRETLRLQLNTTGNRGGHSFVDLGREDGVDVECQSLPALLGDLTPTAMKLDIEGFEHRVLYAYFAETPVERWPGFMIVERQSVLSQGDAEALLARSGYKRILATEANLILKRQHDSDPGG